MADSSGGIVAQFLAQIVATGLGSAAALGSYLWVQRRDQNEQRTIIKRQKLEEIYEAGEQLRYEIEQSEAMVEQRINAAVGGERPRQLPDFSGIIHRHARVRMLIRLPVHTCALERSPR